MQFLHIWADYACRSSFSKGLYRASYRDSHKGKIAGLINERYGMLISTSVPK